MAAVLSQPTAPHTNGVDAHTDHLLSHSNGIMSQENKANGHTNGDTPTPEALLAPTQAFPSIPPFPTNIPTAPLLRLRLSSLLSHNPSEIARFTSACESLGFFYLDLSNTTLGSSIINDADKLFDVGADLFSLPLDEKKKYDFMKENSYFGYKAMGANVLKNGKLDRNEFYNVSKDDVFGIGRKWPAPAVLEEKRDLLKRFMGSAHGIVTLVLGLLNEYLGLPKGLLEGMHRLEGHSGDQVRFIKSPPQPQDDTQVSLGEHTDFGSVTVLFNRLGGLQVLPPGKDAEWCYVKPLPGHAIINLGDAMVKFTNGMLRSNIHRVNAPPPPQDGETRYSLVYFNRPEDDVMLKRLEGSEKIPELKPGEEEEVISSKDWVIRRALAKRHEIKGKAAYDENAGKGTEKLSMRDM